MFPTKQYEKSVCAEGGELREQLLRVRGNKESSPDLSVVIPVNAQGDLDNVLLTLKDIGRYSGQQRVEVVLVINNYESDSRPIEYEQMFTRLGVNVVSVPSVRRPGEAVGFSARVVGFRSCNSEVIVSFDADCRIPHASELLGWYLHELNNGAQAAYTHVDYYDLKDGVSIRFRIALHHLARSVKRNLLGIPTTRGSNYGVRRAVALQLYEQARLADEMNVGPAVRASGGRVAYSGDARLHVLTSGRMFNVGWLKLFRYFTYRLRYNIRVLGATENVATHTGRERDPVRRYVNNRPVR